MYGARLCGDLFEGHAGGPDDPLGIRFSSVLLVVVGESLCCCCCTPRVEVGASRYGCLRHELLQSSDELVDLFLADGEFLVLRAAGDSVTPSKWKKAIDCSLPSSRTVKSAWVRPVTGLPFLSSTVTSTSTSLLPARNKGAGCWPVRITADTSPQTSTVVAERDILAEF